VDEFFDIGMIAAQHAHLRAAPRTGRFDCFAGAVEYAHIRNRAAGARIRTFDQGTLWANGGEIVAYPAAATHGFSRLLQCIVDARFTVAKAGDGITDRLHKAVDQRRLAIQSCSGINTPSGDKTVLLGKIKLIFILSSLRWLLGLRQATRHTATYIFDRKLARFGILLQQYFDTDLLRHVQTSLDARLLKHSRGKFGFNQNDRSSGGFYADLTTRPRTDGRGF
jgi:hypothetical protein